MDAKECIHMKTEIRINREFLKEKKNQNQIFLCLGKKIWSVCKWRQTP